MENVVEISINFNEFELMTICKNWFIADFEKAIDIVKASKINNVQLRQNSNGSVMEWDNF